ncbi:hypothetical protein SDC9_23809 [bioreactor metagenome]|uniref:Uncharacterized protein n=1 Tax=bioreactor metagenome TaxID=1076179 RepID=A0A644UG33_9ZZZZ
MIGDAYFAAPRFWALDRHLELGDLEKTSGISFGILTDLEFISIFCGRVDV